ncbi:MAG: tetratricopeptide repeat protein [Rhizobiaceae bacterium]
MQRLRTLLLSAVFASTLPLSWGAAQANNDDLSDVSIRSFSGAFLAARTAEIDADLDATVKFYRKALVFDPGSEQLQRSLMLALISNEMFDDALPFAEKLKSIPEIERFSRLALAVDSFRKKEFADAEYWLQLALESDLDRLITGIMSAWAKQGQGATEDAFAHLKKLEGPEWFDLFKDYHRALIAEQAGMTELAKKSFDATVANTSGGRSAPNTYWRAVTAQALLLAQLGEMEKASEAIKAGESFAPSRQALKAIRNAIEAGRDSKPLITDAGDGAAEILLNIGAALNRGGGEAFVRLYLQYARALRPQSAAVLIQLGQLAEQQGRSQEAISFYKRVPDDSPMKRLAEMQLGLNLADVDRHDEAVEHLNALLDADPEEMRTYLALGGVHGSRKDYAAAAEIYDRAVEVIGTPSREHWNIFYQRGIAYERQKKWEQAEPNFLKALELRPDQPQVLNYLGYSWVDMNMNLEKGLDMIARAVALRPNDGYIVDSLGWAYYRLERFDDAVRELEKAVSLKPDDPILNDHLGDAYWRAGKKLQAVFQWNHARDMNPELDVLASVEQKLAEGLPPLEPKEKVAMAPRVVLDDSSGNEKTDSRPAVYKVKPGQSLWDIAVEELGDGQRYLDILKLNPALANDPNRIFPGQELRLPAAP